MSSTPGPIFTEADFQRALTEFDLILQNVVWRPGENYFRTDLLFDALTSKGITLALATALFRRLIDDLKVARLWSDTYPAGYSYEPGLPGPVLRSEPETIEWLVMTRERWYSYLAELQERERALQQETAPSEATSPLPDRPNLRTTFNQEMGRLAAGSSDSLHGGVTPFPTPPGAPWASVRIRFVDGETVAVAVCGVTAHFNYAQMGMADGRNARPTKQWELLRAFASVHGLLSWECHHACRANQKRREILARDLKAFFRIDGEPIILTEDRKGWRTVFAIEPDA
jgi:hypothetical protein